MGVHTNGRRVEPTGGQAGRSECGREFVPMPRGAVFGREYGDR